MERPITASAERQLLDPPDKTIVEFVRSWYGEELGTAILELFHADPHSSARFVTHVRASLIREMRRKDYRW